MNKNDKLMNKSKLRIKFQPHKEVKLIMVSSPLIAQKHRDKFSVSVVSVAMLKLLLQRKCATQQVMP
jgi:hypothetical protein